MGGFDISKIVLRFDILTEILDRCTKHQSKPNGLYAISGAVFKSFPYPERAVSRNGGVDCPASGLFL